MQTSVDSVEELMKKHEEFESTSAAHDDRIKALSDQANKLIHAGHYDAAGYVHVYSILRLREVWPLRFS